MTRLGSKTGDSLMTFKARVREADAVLVSSKLKSYSTQPKEKGHQVGQIPDDPEGLPSRWGRYHDDWARRKGQIPTCRQLILSGDGELDKQFVVRHTTRGIILFLLALVEHFVELPAQLLVVGVIGFSGHVASEIF